MVSPRLLVVAGEASGDAHAATVLEALVADIGPVEARGMGGAALSRAGLHLDVDLRTITAMGAVEIARRLPLQLAAFARILSLVRRWRPRAALLVDLPDFNLPLGARLRRLGVRVLGYVAPQFWAWRAGRLGVIRQCYDRLACILPFEERPLREHGVDALFVGHPAAEEGPPSSSSASLREDLRVLDHGRRRGHEGERRLALLPGSRPAEIARLLDPMILAAERLRHRDRRLCVLLAEASSLSLKKGVPRWIHVVGSGDVQRPGRRVLSIADAAAVASGTATLEAALAGAPQVVCYKLSWPSFALAKLLVRTRFIALPNIVLNEPIVPELLQSKLTVDSLTASLGKLLYDESSAEAQQKALEPLRGMLRGPGATGATASLLAEML